ncbi:MAG TPA: tripartite tricarboxylate transporter permease, partial [Ramlibacter sp.]|nr:tripartite tricarboxylate transporter permease [Ramlibacter sp.]
IIVLCAIGAFAVHSAILDVWFMLVFGIVGYILKKLEYPLAPLVLAVVLGDKMEAAFRQSMIGPSGGLGAFWSNSLVGTITTLALLMLFWPLIAFAIRRLLGMQRANPVKAP